MAYLDYTGLSIFLEKIKDLLSKKQNTLTFDTTPTSGSTNPVTSGGIYTSLESKADLTSPTFEGTPKAPTAAVGTNSTQIATTAFVKSAVGGKQDTIADLNTIRSGAALGATAVQPSALDGKEDKVDIVSASGTTLSAEVGKYYTLSNVGTLAITLPTIAAGTTKVQTVTFYISAGSTPAVTFTSTHSIYYSDGFEIAANSTYEVSAAYNGIAWVVASVKIVIPT